MDRFERKIYETLQTMSTEEKLQDLQAKAEKPYRKPSGKKAPEQAHEEDGGQEEPESGRKEPSSDDGPVTKPKEDKSGPVKKAKVVSTPELSEVIEQFNLVRSGKSVKDAEVKEQLKKYFNQLEDSEKIALFAFMKAFADLTSENPAKGLQDDPSDAPYYIDMERRVEDKDEDEKKTKPAPRSSGSGGRLKPDVEQALDVPIVVGESRSQETTDIRSVLRKFLK